MITYQAPKKQIMTGSSLPNVFLAGCANTEWRKDFVKHFDKYDGTFYDPKRDDWSKMSRDDLWNQVRWEYERLRLSDIIVYHFNVGSVCPITLLEYGTWGLSKGTPIAVYVEEGYEKWDDIYLQTKNARPDVPILDSEESLIEMTKALIEEHIK